MNFVVKYINLPDTIFVKFVRFLIVMRNVIAAKDAALVNNDSAEQ